MSKVSKVELQAGVREMPSPETDLLPFNVTVRKQQQ